MVHGAIKDEYIHNLSPQQCKVTKILSLTPYNTSRPCPPCIFPSHYTSPSCAAKTNTKTHINVISLRIPEAEADAEAEAEAEAGAESEAEAEAEA